ncbi:hypothetical protein ACJX0J_005785, partial [Zea mays]
MIWMIYMIGKTIRRKLAYLFSPSYFLNSFTASIQIYLIIKGDFFLWSKSLFGLNKILICFAHFLIFKKWYITQQ